MYGLSPSVASIFRSSGLDPLEETLTSTKSPSLSLRGTRSTCAAAITESRMRDDCRKATDARCAFWNSPSYYRVTSFNCLERTSFEFRVCRVSDLTLNQLVAAEAGVAGRQE